MMRRPLRQRLTWTAIVWLALAGSPLLAAEKAAGEIEEQRRLARGEVVVATGPHGPARRSRAVGAAILIDAPVERVWEVMVDCPHAPEFVPGMRECQVLESAADHETIRHRVKISALLPEVKYTFRATYRRFERIDFVRTGGDLKHLEGSWTLEAVEGGRRTLVRYSVYLDPGFLAPQWLVRQALRHDLPELLSALRRRVIGSSG
jgi:ribosome-associated toxin RatA of RatAB toxin-antitoxin module